mmetsp:Transcript_77245/g.208517  ORF Transcript_77245/g.208517 Transcript_77245/m.208517 type:complete len:95 (+) Transcript_77245:479-763(+)
MEQASEDYHVHRNSLMNCRFSQKVSAAICKEFQILRRCNLADCNTRHVADPAEFLHSTLTNRSKSCDAEMIGVAPRANKIFRIADYSFAVPRAT